MVKIFALFLTVLFAGLALAADPAPNQGMPAGCPMMKQGMTPAAGETGAMDKQMCAPMTGGYNTAMCKTNCMPQNRFGCHPCKRLVMAGILMLALINLLLTVLVAKDMSKLGRFNGIWIPLLLVCGIPVTALYALFRIGDNLKALEDKKA